jgi:hypothetical protein
VVVFYALYTVVRDINGRQPVSVARARANALALVHGERVLHVFVEQRVQAAFIGDRWLIRLLDDFYGTVHFAAVIVVLVLLYWRHPGRYRLWRNTLAITTVLALVGFLTFPVMPPRLLPPSYHFVDTLATIGGLWSFGSAPAATLSNQFAAFPSLHTAWSAWCALALASVVRPWWGRALLFVYPAVTVFCIVVTANHYFADAAAGLVVLGVAVVVARNVERRLGPARPRS